MRLATSLVVLIGAASAHAVTARADVTAPPPAPRVGLTQEVRVAPDKGFVDDPIAFDGARLAYVNTDGATFGDLVVYDVATRSDKVRVALPADLGASQTLRLLGSGDAARVLVIGRGDDGAARAALIGLDGKVVRRFGPAADLTLVDQGGAPRIALHRTKAIARGGVSHSLELVELDKGKRVGKLRTLDVDGGGTVARLDFHVNHWTSGYTHAVGIKGGHWDPKENQRTTDVLADYDLIAGSFTTAPIADVVANTKRLLVLAARPGGGDPVFARMGDDHASVELWRDGQPTELALDQPLAQYDAATLGSAVDEHGGAWIALEVDPVNAAAVKRQKADPQYIDLFAVDTGGKATRKARLLATPKKQYRWGLANGRWWLLERSVGFDRGGTSLTIYKLD